MSLLRAEIETLEENGIAKVAQPRIGDPSVIALWYGEGDRPTPEFIREAAKRGLDDGYTFYGHMRGQAELRDAIKAYVDRIYHIDLDPDRITVPGSAMLGITTASQMALTSGDHGLIVGPSWPNIERTFGITGAEVSFVRQREAAGQWAIDMASIEGASRPNTKALYVNTPCNPTGWVMPVELQEALLAFCRTRGIVLIADEVYHRNVYAGDVAPSFIQLARDDDPLISVNSFSKAWAMTGWRLGWMVTPSRYVKQLATISECFNTSATAFVQRAGIVALEEGEGVVHELREHYARGRDIVTEVLAPHPRIELTTPRGAFYAFPRLRGMRSSLEFAQGLLAEENVGVAPGYAFGPGNESYFRLCFAQSHDRLREALGRIKTYIDRHDNEFDG